MYIIHSGWWNRGQWGWHSPSSPGSIIPAPPAPRSVCAGHATSGRQDAACISSKIPGMENGNHPPTRETKKEDTKGWASDHPFVARISQESVPDPGPVRAKLGGGPVRLRYGGRPSSESEGSESNHRRRANPSERVTRQALHTVLIGPTVAPKPGESLLQAAHLRPLTSCFSRLFRAPLGHGSPPARRGRYPSGERRSRHRLAVDPVDPFGWAPRSTPKSGGQVK